MQGVPAYVTLAWTVGLLGAPLILLVPPPRRVARHSKALCPVFLRVAAALAVLAAAFAVFDLWWPGLTLGGVTLIALMAMFWTASEPRRRRTRSDEDEERPGGDGGEPRHPRPRQDPDGPGGAEIDWGEFDRRRETWQRPAAHV